MRLQTIAFLLVAVNFGAGCDSATNQDVASTPHGTEDSDTGGEPNRSDEDTDGGRDPNSGGRPVWAGTGTFSDSSVAFEARVLAQAVMSDPATQEGEVVLSFSFRPGQVNVPPSDGPMHEAVVATWALSFDELEAVFAGDPWVPSSAEEQQVIFYPRATDGQWIGRDVVGLRIERLSNGRIDAEFELADVRDDIMPHVGEAPAETSTTTFIGPVTLLCSVFNAEPEPVLVADSRLESTFCTEFAARLALEE